MTGVNMDKKYSTIIKEYYNEVREAYELGNVESSYNPPIIKMITEFGCAARDLSGQRIGKRGENIDIKLWHNESEVTEIEPFGGIEVKKIGGIDERAKSQIIIEVNSFGNAILTDNLEWKFWCDGNTEMYAEIQLLELKNGELSLNKENVDLFISLLKDFLLKDPTQIKSSTKLAEYMAIHGQSIRSIVKGILKEDEKGMPLLNDTQKKLPMFLELYGLYNKIKTELDPSMKTKKFSDMYAQTIVYGLFIARYNDKTLDTFNKYEALGNLQEESELLKQFFTHITTGKTHPTLDNVVDKLCELYKICDISLLLAEDDHNDPIVHFYEEFLTYYDPKLRKDLGVFYTPVQTVHYLVNMVDEILVNELNVDKGLSNNEQISTIVPCKPKEIKKGKWVTDEEIIVPRIAILDPACGTGSFGAEIIKVIKDKYFSDGREAFYEEYIQDKNGLLSRVIGFEIMMTSYVVAHLKLRRMVKSTLGHAPYAQLPINIFLTNSLAPPMSNTERGEQLTLFDFSAAITDEAYHADTWKARRPIKVVIGNPPWLSTSSNPYDISTYKKETDGITDFGEKKHLLNDDYVKFFHFAEQIINKEDSGILAFVSNNGYLQNPTFRGMRGSLLRTFDKIWIVNLHGSANKQETTPDGEKDENIFDIMVGVSLFIGVKKTDTDDWAKVYYTDLWGTKDYKLNTLEKGGLDFTELTIDKKMAYFVPFGSDDKEYYDAGVSITELFPTNVTGVQSGKDKVALAPTRDILIERMDKVKHATDDNEILSLWTKFSRGQSAQKIKEDVISNGKITEISYRPFDSRWTYYTGNSCGWLLWPREKSTMGHLLAKPTSPIGENIGLVFGRTSTQSFSPFVSKKIIAHRLFSAKCEITYVAPLYLVSTDERGVETWDANIDEKTYNKLTEYIQEKPSPIEVFDYVYGILHDPTYSEQYEEYLCKDFPRVPVINDKSIENEDKAFFVSEDLFKEYIATGSKLRKLHLMDSKIPAQLILEPNNSDDLEIGSIKYKKGILHLNKRKQILGIPEDVWNYQIGGYKVIDKWFKEHKGELLNIDNFDHIVNIVGLLEETIKLENYLRDLHQEN